MELTKERAIEEHRKMWNWIAEQYENVSEVLIELHNIDRLKNYYIKENHSELEDYEIDYNCFCCEYDDQFDGDCLHCPLEWGGAYSSRDDFVLCGKIARKIANLPERRETEEV